MTRSSSNCPVCNRKAKRNTATGGDYAAIICDQCGHFQISGTLQHIFPSYPMSVRRLALDHAQLRSRYGAVPLITTYDLP